MELQAGLKMKHRRIRKVRPGAPAQCLSVSASCAVKFHGAARFERQHDVSAFPQHDDGAVLDKGVELGSFELACSSRSRSSLIRTPFDTV